MEHTRFPIKPSPHDDRDYELPLGSTLPQDDFNLGDAPYLDQGRTSQCGNYTFTGIMQPHFDVKLSPSYAYANRFNDGEYKGEGVFARDILKDIHRDGLCEAYWMSEQGTIANLMKEFLELPQEAHDNAALHKIESYYRLSKRPDSFLDIMRKTRCMVGLSIPLYRNTWIRAKATGIVFPPEEGDELVGGHLIKCNGQTDGYIRTVNSWGENIPTLIHKDYPIWEAWLPVPKVATKIEMFNGSSTYTVNGIGHKMDTSPQIINGRMMVPLRFLMDSMLGTFVDWDQATRTGHVYRGGQHLHFREGDSSFFAEAGLNTVKYDEGVTNIINEDDRMLVPVRKVMEFFKWNVHYNHDSRLITIHN